jgi:hypothetical protein
VAAIVTFVAALGSVALQLYAGRPSPQILVLILIAGWVLSPFAVLGFLHLRANRWPTVPRTTLYCVMLLVAFSSLAVYGLAVVRPLVAKPPAFLFVALPPVSLLLVAVGLAAAWIAGRSRHVESGR